MRKHTILILFAMGLTGCYRGQPAGELQEATFQAQVTSVRNGKSNAIHLSQHSVTDEDLAYLVDLESLASLRLEKSSENAAE